jgi:hypothetical protein
MFDTSPSLHTLRQRVRRLTRAISALPLGIPPKPRLAIAPAAHILTATGRSRPLAGRLPELRPC